MLERDRRIEGNQESKWWAALALGLCAWLLRSAFILRIDSRLESKPIMLNGKTLLGWGVNQEGESVYFASDEAEVMLEVDQGRIEFYDRQYPGSVKGGERLKASGAVIVTMSEMPKMADYRVAWKGNPRREIVEGVELVWLGPVDMK